MKTKPMEGWDEAFGLMHEEKDDALLIIDYAMVLSLHAKKYLAMAIMDVNPIPAN